MHTRVRVLSAFLFAFVNLSMSFFPLLATNSYHDEHTLCLYGDDDADDHDDDRHKGQVAHERRIRLASKERLVSNNNVHCARRAFANGVQLLVKRLFFVVVPWGSTGYVQTCTCGVVRKPTCVCECVRVCASEHTRTRG